jgi:hypothetical protein
MKTAMMETAENNYKELIPGFIETNAPMNTSRKYVTMGAVRISDKIADSERSAAWGSNAVTAINNDFNKDRFSQSLTNIYNNVSFIEDLAGLGCASPEDLGNLAKLVKQDILELALNI